MAGSKRGQRRNNRETGSYYERMAGVYLTEKGTQLCRQIVIPLIEAEQHSLAQMTAEEVELCLKLSVRQLDLFEEELALILPKKEHPSGE